jgi:hypothetical protein
MQNEFIGQMQANTIFSCWLFSYSNGGNLSFRNNSIISDEVLWFSSPYCTPTAKSKGKCD